MDTSEYILTEDEERDISHAWKIITQKLLSEKVEVVPSLSSFQEALLMLGQNKLIHVAAEWFLLSFKERLVEVYVPHFWDHFHKRPNAGIWTFPRAVASLATLFEQLEEPLLLLDSYRHVAWLSECQDVDLLWPNSPLINQAYSLLNTFLFVGIPPNFSSILLEFYSKIFKVYHHQTRSNKSLAEGSMLDVSGEEEEELDSLQCNGCESESEMCQCSSLLETLHTITSHMKQLQILDKMTYEVMITVIQSQMESYIRDTCKGNFETPYISSLCKWLEDTVSKWLELVNPEFCDPDNILRNHLNYLLYEKYVNVRMEQMFNIIIEFPESLSAIEDLLDCFKTINFRNQLISSVKESFIKRLLHPGVNTSDILTAFVSTIKTLRILDSSGVVLQQVSEPVCRYLRRRSDTVRCIVASILDDSSSDLTAELLKGGDGNSLDEDWESWEPEPLDGGGELSPRMINDYINGNACIGSSASILIQHGRGSSGDLMGLLSNIYGSNEVFVDEYRSLLAERLLASMSFNCDRERRHLELLKLRFGEAPLHVCEVMLKDVSDSNRISLLINSEAPDPESIGKDHYNVLALIVSTQFWPTFREGHLRLPEELWLPLKAYQKSFETLKGNRTLVWKPHLGTVHMEVTLKDRTLSFTVSPVLVALLWYFQQQAEWTVEALSKLTNIPTDAVRRKLAWWAGQGVLGETQPDRFIVLEEQCKVPSLLPHSTAGEEEEEEEATVTASAHDQKEAELQTCWSYVVGMLTNLDSLPLERIHTMLRMFGPSGGGECSLGELRHFLDSKVRSQELLYTAGVYRLPPSP